MLTYSALLAKKVGTHWLYTHSRLIQHADPFRSVGKEGGHSLVMHSQQNVGSFSWNSWTLWVGSGCRFAAKKKKKKTI